MIRFPKLTHCLTDSVGIEEVRSDDNSLVLERPVDLIADIPAVADGVVLEVVAHSEDQVWVESVAGLSPGGVLTQERAIVTDAAILERFASVWGARWTKHAHVLPSQWDQICSFRSDCHSGGLDSSPMDC